MTTPATTIQLTAYWCTLHECAGLLRVSLRTVQRHLHAVPKTDRVLVTRSTGGSRRTRYWRVSPHGVRLLGHSTGQAPYL